MFETTSVNKFNKNIFLVKNLQVSKKNSKPQDQWRAARFGQALVQSELGICSTSAVCVN